MTGKRRSEEREPEQVAEYWQAASDHGPIVRRLGILVVLLACGLLAWLVWPFWHLSKSFGGYERLAPSRVYARPERVVRGQGLEPSALGRSLDGGGYRKVEGEVPAPGQYVVAGERWIIHRRPFPTAGGIKPPALLEVELRRDRVRSLRLHGEDAEAVDLEPALLATLVGDDRQERRPVDLEQLPEELVQAVLAAEDAGFFGHAGISVRGIARAAWRNLSEEGGLQGGSTLTQQLVKNLYLTHERTLDRKLREATLSLLIELRYGKRDILEAYLNEIYWGHSRGVSLMGVGAAARAYFGKDAMHLDLAEAATLAGAIQAPNRYAPNRHPEAARERRDWVLGRMREEGWLDDAAYQEAVESPLVPFPQPVIVRRAPWFVERVLDETRDRYGIDAREEQGLAILTSLDWSDQQEAEQAVAWGLEALEEGWERDTDAADLQAALVSVAPDSGEIRAWVGGRDYESTQFDRASMARRQAGSAFKPVVYATALSEAIATPATMIPDQPLTVQMAHASWEPRNDDRDFRGWVTVRQALEKSLNVPTARVAISVGIERVLEMARALGVTSPLQPYPALALGAFEVTPEEMATVYATLAAGGVRRPLIGVTAVLEGRNVVPVARPLAPPKRVLTPQVAYVLTSMLQGVVTDGTAAGVRLQGVSGPVAGKTGTTNGRRDSWFGGYSPDRSTTVWVGYDDNRETSLSGSRAALPIWGRFSASVQPARGYQDFLRPPGVETAFVDPQTGLRAARSCPEVRSEVFVAGSSPLRYCSLHEGRSRPWLTSGKAPAEAPTLSEPSKPKRSWWKRVFGKKNRKKDRDKNDGGP